MARVTIEFETGNEAFTSDYETEVAHVLEYARRELVDWVLSAGKASLLDFNGNTVGKVTVSE